MGKKSKSFKKNKARGGRQLASHVFDVADAARRLSTRLQLRQILLKKGTRRANGMI